MQAIRLPTEAVWEYACRAGTTTTFYSGDTEADLARVAWYYGNGKSTTHPVGQKEPNAFGLYDMHGNVNQWCQDMWQDDQSKPSFEAPQKLNYDDESRVLRGGSWIEVSRRCSSASRGRTSPDIRGSSCFTGFRIVSAPGSQTP